MEFNLDRTQLEGFEARLDTTLLQEETLEMIVPDACPDILRVVETDGRVLLRSKEVMEGRAEVAGTIQAVVLYLPDGEAGIRHLDVTIPFTCAAENPEINSDSRMELHLHLRHADTKAVNPRKVLVRAEAALDLTVFSPVQENICGHVENAEETQVEQLTETEEVYMAVCIQEKPFSFSDEISLSAGKPSAVELLKSRVKLCRGESKIIGNKLIFKGSASVTLLCRGENGELYTASGELPFSQIMEVSSVGEGADCSLSLVLTGAVCNIADGDGRTVAVSLDVLAQAVIREPRTLEILVDAYSTRQPIVADRETYTLSKRLDNGVRSQNAREVWETGMAVREVTDCHIGIGPIARSREGERLLLTAPVEITAFCIGEDGSPSSFQRQMNLPCPLELPEDAQCFCRCEESGDIYATPAAGGIEVRFTLDFHYLALSRRQVTGLVGLQPGEATVSEGEQPSLVLRMLEPHERLWDVAKSYSTTITDIINANELEEESDAVGKLLLIPRKR